MTKSKTSPKTNESKKPKGNDLPEFNPFLFISDKDAKTPPLGDFCIELDLTLLSMLHTLYYDLTEKYEVGCGIYAEEDVEKLITAFFAAYQRWVLICKQYSN